MFEATMAHLESIAAVEIGIATALVAQSTAKTIGTLGADSPELAIDLAALAAANAAAASAALALVGLEAARVVMATSVVTVGGIGTASAGHSAALTAAVEATA